MDSNNISREKIKDLYPDEWVLLANPEMLDTKVLSGVLLFHSKDKKEVCYIGRDKATGFEKYTIVFTGELNQNRKVGIFRRL